MKFSIIIPIYNVENYLAECLNSVLNQTYSDYEVICVNDASTDNSADILLEYQKKSDKIKVITHQENRGLSFSRNRGLKDAIGEYIWFVDSDDYIMTEALSIFAKILEDGEIDMLNFDHELLYLNGNRKQRFLYSGISAIKSGQTWFYENTINQTLSENVWSKVFKRSFLQENNLFFYENLLHEDLLFLIQAVLCAKQVLSIKDCLYVYRKRSNSITMNKTEKHLDSLIIIMNEILTLWKTNKLESGMDYALEIYIKRFFFNSIRVYMKMFPEHRKLGMGKTEDQILLDALYMGVEFLKSPYVDLNKEQLNTIKNFKHKIVYGAGNIAIELIYLLDSFNISIDGIAVTSMEGNIKQIRNYSVYQIDDLLHMKDSALVIIGVGNKNQQDVCDKLQALGFTNIMLLNTDGK